MVTVNFDASRQHFPGPKVTNMSSQKKKRKEKVNDMLAILSIKRVNMDNESLIFEINPQCSLFFFFFETPNAKLLIFFCE